MKVGRITEKVLAEAMSQTKLCEGYTDELVMQFQTNMLSIIIAFDFTVIYILSRIAQLTIFARYSISCITKTSKRGSNLLKHLL